MARSCHVALVACVALLITAALVESRSVRKKRQLATDLCQPLPAPGHATIACGSGLPFYSCTATCDPGYIFPSGTPSDKRECDQMFFGEWFDPPGENIDDCVPVAVKSHCPDGQASLPNHNCGRGIWCPSTHYCEISPVDAYAECCPTSIIG